MKIIIQKIKDWICFQKHKIDFLANLKKHRKKEDERIISLIEKGERIYPTL